MNSLSKNSATSFIFIYLGKVLPLEYSYLNWLVYTLRPISTNIFKLNVNQLGLDSDYIKATTQSDPIDLVRLIQFLKFTRNLPYDTELLDDGNVVLRVFTFRIRDFLTSLNQTQNQYQVAKLYAFFEGLHKSVVIESFHDRHFRCLAAVPLSKVYSPTKPGQPLIAKVWLADDLFHYEFSFYLPDLFLGKLKKHQLNVRIHILERFSTQNIEKIFYIRKFCQNYPAQLSHQQTRKLKINFLESIAVLKQCNLIDNRYKIISDGKLQDIQELTSRNISERFVIYEKIHI